LISINPSIMKTLLSFILILLLGTISAQNKDYELFQREAKFNKRLLPKLGSTTKSIDQIESERAYVKKTMKEYSSAREASDTMVKRGYELLKTDLKEAMNNFNNAYLLDSSNANVFWGFGRVYSEFGDYDLAEKYYREGLFISEKNTMLLNALGKNFQDRYAQEELKEYLEKSIELLQSSYKLESKNAETSELLSWAYIKLGDCKTATKYFNYHIAVAGNDSNESLRKAIMNCKSSD